MLTQDDLKKIGEEVELLGRRLRTVSRGRPKRYGKFSRDQSAPGLYLRPAILLRLRFSPDGGTARRVPARHVVQAPGEFFPLSRGKTRGLTMA